MGHSPASTRQTATGVGDLCSGLSALEGTERGAQRIKRFRHLLCVIEPEGKRIADEVHQKRIRGWVRLKSHPLRLRHGDDYVKSGAWASILCSMASFCWAFAEPVARAMSRAQT